MNDTNDSKNTASLEKAYLAGGCFWCMEPPYEKLAGVISVVSGFIGGDEKNPSYRDVAGGKTGHTEAVEITFDSRKITFEKLLDVYWLNIDPTDRDGQFVDRGKQYRPGIFYTSDEQKKTAEKSKAALEAKGLFNGEAIAVEITRATPFWPAEDYHQDYYKKNPIRYKFYRSGSGRDNFLKKHWK